ncbi:MAG TPA: VOC family protein [Terriglobia bacterium]|nr:VOC family protein [Terriglobia bacterium]
MRKRIILFTLLFAFGNGNAFCQNGSAPANDLGIQYLGHVAVRVTNLAAALHFYCDELGLPEIFRINRASGSVLLVYLRVNNNNFVELLPGDKSSTDPAPLSGPHMGFYVKDLQASLHALQAKGYPLPEDAFTKAAKVLGDGTVMYFIHDPDGNGIELSQMLPDSKEAKSQR